MRYWLAFDVGCIECAERSAVIGVFKTEAEAKAAADKVRAKQEEDWEGKHSMEVFEITVPPMSDEARERIGDLQEAYGEDYTAAVRRAEAAEAKLVEIEAQLAEADEVVATRFVNGLLPMWLIDRCKSRHAARQQQKEGE